MRQRNILICFLAALFVVPTLSAVEAQITELDGRVELRGSAGEDWVDAEVGMIVPVGATISTGFGASAVLALTEDTDLRVDSLSRLTIEELIEREGVLESDIDLPVGRVEGEVRRTEERDTQFEVRSPTATASVRGTSFAFDGVNVQVFEGQVDISNRFNQRSSVSAGERSSSTGDEPPPSGDAGREADSSVNIYSDGADERTESSIEGRESDRAILRLQLQAGETPQ